MSEQLFKKVYTCVPATKLVLKQTVPIVVTEDMVDGCVWEVNGQNICGSFNDYSSW